MGGGLKTCIIIAAIVLIVPYSSFSGEKRASEEIAYLLQFLADSDCEFNRNGTWYQGEKVVDHIKRKYNYLLKKNLVDSTESFIDRAASKSSMSGRPYTVRCGVGEPVASGVWFREELKRLRGKIP